MRVLLLGDICGRPGRDIVKEKLPEIRSTYQPDLVIANGENAAGGFGLTKKIAEELFGLGIDVITSGNHIWIKGNLPVSGRRSPFVETGKLSPSVPGITYWQKWANKSGVII